MATPNEPGRAAALEEALGVLGLEYRVEARGGLAVLSLPAGRHRPVTGEERRQVLQLARAHGFSHAALELPPAG